ncbi:MAG: aminotransferase class V-fold PLP-dependent enzyme, partial [Bacteroidales bacterium]|nr:aminotransferase class V-fold PLP-dependent enzyme [Bacteroidales bacterium]
IFEPIADHEADLSELLLDFLKSKKNVFILGSDSHDKHVRVPTISFSVKNVKSSEIPPKVDPHGIGIRWGDFYATRLISDCGLNEQDGIIRISMVHYNTKEEVEKLIKVLDSVI